MNKKFLNSECKEESKTDSQFGLCDDQDGKKAYSSTNEEDDWIAIVENSNEKEIAFTPIDNCISVYKDTSPTDEEKTCDGMLTFENGVYLVELKKQEKRWQERAIDQLKTTIKLLVENENLEQFTYKKAYACNKKHPNFSVISNEKKKRFMDENNGFRLDIQSNISIK